MYANMYGEQLSSAVERSTGFNGSHRNAAYSRLLQESGMNGSPKDFQE